MSISWKIGSNISRGAVVASFMAMIPFSVFGGTVQVPEKFNKYPPVKEWQDRRSASQKMFVLELKKAGKDEMQSAEVAGRIADWGNMRLTPLEMLDMLGIAALPKEGVENVLPAIMAVTIVALYDMKRFASDSAVKEILSKERLFVLPYSLAGQAEKKKALSFIAKNQEEVKRAFEEASLAAEEMKNSAAYHQGWSIAFGSEDPSCEDEECEFVIHRVPESEWEKTFEEAKKQVADFYRIR